MRSVDTDSLLANIPLEEIANICCKTLFKNTRRVQVILKITFKEKFSRAINGSYSIFHWKLYKQGDGVAMGSLFGPTFLYTLEKIGCKIVQRNSWLITTGDMLTTFFFIHLTRTFRSRPTFFKWSTC